MTDGVRDVVESLKAQLDSKYASWAAHDNFAPEDGSLWAARFLNQLRIALNGRAIEYFEFIADRGAYLRQPVELVVFTKRTLIRARLDEPRTLATVLVLPRTELKQLTVAQAPDVLEAPAGTVRYARAIINAKYGNFGIRLTSGTGYDPTFDALVAGLFSDLDA